MDSACLRWLDESQFISGHNGLDRGAYAKFCKNIAFVGSYGVLAAILKDGDILYLYASIGIHKLSPVGSKFFHIHYIGFPLFLQGYAASFFRSPSASERSEKKMQKNLRK